jgi:hypothetical protein
METDMSRSTIYLALAVIGAVAPYVFFLQFFAAEGLAGDFIGALFVNGASGGFATDLLLTSLVFWIYLFHEARRVGVARPWIFVLINLLIGLSCALPLFLWARERRALARAKLATAA